MASRITAVITHPLRFGPPFARKLPDHGFRMFPLLKIVASKLGDLRR
jgi:hypothetical protein